MDFSESKALAPVSISINPVASLQAVGVSAEAADASVAKFKRDMLKRLVQRDHLFGAVRSPPIRPQERAALYYILQHAKSEVLHRVPPTRNVVGLKPEHTPPFTQQPAKSLQADAHAFIADRRELLLAFGSTNSGKPLKLASPHPDDPVAFEVNKHGHLRVTLADTGHELSLPLTTQKRKHLKKIRRDVDAQRSIVTQTGDKLFAPAPHHQRHLAQLGAAIDILADGLRLRENPKKKHKSQDKMAPITRHVRFVAYEEASREEVEHAKAMGLEINVHGMSRSQRSTSALEKARRARLARHPGT